MVSSSLTRMKYNSSSHLIIGCALVALCVIGGVYGRDVTRISLDDIQTLTLYKDHYTTARRGSPIAQLKCVGNYDTCVSKYQPSIVQCRNQGSDGGGNVQWRCDAALDNDVQFDRVEVSCEGFDHSHDSHVFYGSCGLEYELKFTNKYHERMNNINNANIHKTTTTTTSTVHVDDSASTIHRTTAHADDSSTIVFFFLLLLIFGIVFSAYLWPFGLTGFRQYDAPNRHHWYSWGYWSPAPVYHIRQSHYSTPLSRSSSTTTTTITSSGGSGAGNNNGDIGSSRTTSGFGGTRKR